jgi:hypothetical protein
MIAFTSFGDAIMRSESLEVGLLFPALRKGFLVRQPLTAIKAKFSDHTNDVPQTSSDQHVMHQDVLIRLPSLRDSKWKVNLLQQWVGSVERVGADAFVALLEDMTNSQNPPEQVELDLREVSASDLPLLAVGATFYWSIGYRDTSGGQRERISTVRFARQPRLSNGQTNHIFEQADRSAGFLESD